jgi:polysaccharide pyruvyl transferase WcaK-like protein
MTKKRPKLLIPERVPLENKGEEAIVRGLADVLFPEALGQVDIAVMHDVDVPTVVRGIKVFPVSWLYASGSSSFINQAQTQYDKGLKRFLKKILNRKRYWIIKQGFLGKKSILLERENAKYQELLDFYWDSDVVISGHDGAYQGEHYLIIKACKMAGKCVGLFGSGMNSRVTAPHMTVLRKKGIELADFCILRERQTMLQLQSLSPSTPMTLAPDPAFGMIPSTKKEAQYELMLVPEYVKARQDGRPVIAVTVCENSKVFNDSFKDAKTYKEKQDRHARFVAQRLDSLNKVAQPTFLFLPHSYLLTEFKTHEFNNDIPVSQLVASHMETPSENIAVVDRDISAKTLKAIINDVDFMIGERTHSLIGSASVGTPFVGLTNSNDTRTHDILGSMCNCERCLFDMDIHSSSESADRFFTEKFCERDQIREHLNTIRPTLSKELEKSAQIVRAKMTGRSF